MLIYKPSYYDAFSCIASDCPDSCCKDWQIQVDSSTARRYSKMKNGLGADLRCALKKKGGRIYFANRNGRCPMWRDDGLCRVQAELGEEALCATCRDFPRLRHDYGSFQEWGLELSCPEAARLILSAPAGPMVTMELPGEKPADYDQEDMDLLLESRRKVHTLLADTSRPIGETLALVLLYGCHAQSELDGENSAPFDPEAALKKARKMAEPGDKDAFMEIFPELELLTTTWEDLLYGTSIQPWNPATLALARYLVDRYWLQAIADNDLYCRVKLVIILCLLARFVETNFIRRTQLMSKEIENNTENVDALLDAAYYDPVLRDSHLLGLLFC